MLKKNCKARHYHPKIWMEQRPCWIPNSDGTIDMSCYNVGYIIVPTKQVFLSKFKHIMDEPLILYVRKIQDGKQVDYLMALIENLSLERITLTKPEELQLLDNKFFQPNLHKSSYQFEPIGSIHGVKVLSVNFPMPKYPVYKNKGVSYHSIYTGARLIDGRFIVIIEAHNKRQYKNICNWLNNI